MLSKIFARFVEAYVAVFSPTVNAAKSAAFSWGVTFDRPKAQAAIEADAIEIAKAKLIEREGYSLTVYVDPLADKAWCNANIGKSFSFVRDRCKPTVGIGHLVLASDNLTLGDKISAEKADEFFMSDIQKSLTTSRNQAIELEMFTEEFLAALINVNFQLGNFKSKFPNSFNRLKEKRYAETIAALRQSDWFKQTPKRVNDFIAAIEAYEYKYARGYA
jgi:lysozyme